MTDDVHNAWVEQWPSPFDKSWVLWSANCSCGWQAFALDTLDDANVAVEIHLLGQPT